MKVSNASAGARGVGTRECDEQVAKHYDTAVVNFAGIKYPLKIYSGGEMRQPVLAGGHAGSLIG